jgi:hypothetical protein
MWGTIAACNCVCSPVNHEALLLLLLLLLLLVLVLKVLCAVEESVKLHALFLLPAPADLIVAGASETSIWSIRAAASSEPAGLLDISTGDDTTPMLHCCALCFCAAAAAAAAACAAPCWEAAAAAAAALPASSCLSVETSAAATVMPWP